MWSAVYSYELGLGLKRKWIAKLNKWSAKISWKTSITITRYKRWTIKLNREKKTKNERNLFRSSISLPKEKRKKYETGMQVIWRVSRVNFVINTKRSIKPKE